VRPLRLGLDAVEQRPKALELRRQRVLELVFVGPYQLVLHVFEVTSQVRAEQGCFLGRELEVHARLERIDRAKLVRRLLKVSP
jgi:hypothetical protein